MGMSDEQLYEAQPEKDFVFNMYDENTNVEYRNVTVPNWMARDGRWAEIYNALSAARNGKFASATEQIVKAMERVREFGRLEAQLGQKPEGLPVPEGEIKANPDLGPDHARYYESSRDKSQRDVQERSYRGLRRPFDPAFPERAIVE